MGKEVMMLIPVYRPDEKLLQLVKELRELTVAPIVIVDDGNSSAEAQGIFLELRQSSQVYILHHSENKGKGAALKTGFQYVLKHFPDSIGVVTLDADGQHAPHDVLRLMDCLRQEPSRVILGMRCFSGSHVPFRSRFGNQITAKLFHLVTGQVCPDTQTGLRGLPLSVLPDVLAVQGEHFDYEMYQLLALAKHRYPFVSIPIETIYIDNNRSSHYNPLIDSLKILAVIFKFMLASSIGGIVDILGFLFLSRFIFTNTMTGVILATIMARLISGGVNYLINVKWVFSSQSDPKTIWRYSALFLSLMGLSALLVGNLSSWFGSSFWTKLVVDSVLFVISYKVQKNYVFRSPQLSQTAPIKAMKEQVGGRMI